MSLHARQVAVSAGAPEELVGAIAAQMVSEGNIHVQRAVEILENWSSQ
jgi:hydroxymethylglutaryl-CoA reductase